jgi:hypothetical protein
MIGRTFSIWMITRKKRESHQRREGRSEHSSSTSFFRDGCKRFAKNPVAMVASWSFLLCHRHYHHSAFLPL